jgi:NADP-dependent 3-hydroxy acid dehydrogenase YdfG
MSATRMPCRASRNPSSHVTGNVDVLVNSAGLNNPQRFWRDQTVESWNQVIRANLDGTFYCTKAVIPSMRTQKDGVVINISSWAGKYTSPWWAPLTTAAKPRVKYR